MSQVFCVNFPGCGALSPVTSGCLFTANPPWVSSLNPTFQHSTPSTPGDTQLIVECSGLRHRSCMHFLLCSAFPWSPKVPFLPQLISPHFLNVGTCPHLQPPARIAGLFFLFLFFFSFFGPTRLLGHFSYPLRCPESSTNVQKMLCENCSICRCILDVIVRRDKFWVLLFCHLDFPLKFFSLMNFAFSIVLKNSSPNSKSCWFFPLSFLIEIF